MKKRLLYYCSYVPVDILEKAGFEMLSIHELALNEKGRIGLPASPCSFIQYCCDIPYETYDGVIFVNCCNSSQRMYDYVHYHYQNIFSYILELPRVKGEIWNYQGLMQELNEYFGCCIQLGKERNDQQKWQNFSNGKEDFLILSSAVHQEYVRALEALFDGFLCRFITCSNECRGMRFLMGEEVSCPRRLNYFSFINKQITKVRGVILISLKNCDPIFFSSPVINMICQEKKVNYLLVEEEYGIKLSSRSRLRYEAFLEELEVRQRKNGK